MKIEFFVPGTPKAQKRHRHFAKGNFKGVYDPSSSDRKDFLAKAFTYAPDKPLDQPICLTVMLVMPRPKSHFRTGKFAGLLKESAPHWHTKKPDSTNMLKFIEDAFNGVFWRDDSFICHHECLKIYGDRPGVNIIIQKAEDYVICLHKNKIKTLI